MEIRIDDLAQRAGVPTRTIRYYTQQGLLSPPSLRGRVGYYNARHVERLKLIKELQEKRFLPLSVIRSVVRGMEEGADLETMLTPLDMVFAPRPNDADEHREFTRRELAAHADVDSSVIDAAEEMGLLFPNEGNGEPRYTADDLRMIDVARAWLDLELPRSLAHIYRKSLDEISKLQVQAYTDSVVHPAAAEHLPPEQMRKRLTEGYREMERVFTHLVALLHRKLLQKAVEARAAETPPVTDNPAST